MSTSPKKRMELKRGRTCPRKFRYEDRAGAERAVADMRRSPHVAATAKRLIEAYPCPVCAGWHVGRRWHNRATA